MKTTKLPAEGPNRTVLEVISVVISKGTITFADDDPYGDVFLGEHKFTDIRVLKLLDHQYKVAAASPVLQKILIEYDPQKKVPCIPFKMFRKFGGDMREIESGKIILMDALPENGKVALAAHGEGIMIWDIVAGPVTDEKVIGHTIAPIDISTESGLPSTAAVMIRDELEKREQTSGPSMEALAILRNDRERYHMWAHNNRILSYMNKHYGGDHRVSAISVALNALVDNEGKKPYSIARDFAYNVDKVRTLLWVKLLHPDLQPFLDRIHGDPQRISPETLKILARIPFSEQARLLDEARNKSDGTVDGINGKLKIVGDAYIRQFNENNLWHNRKKVVSS